MTPPVVSDPRLRVPGGDLLIATGLILTAYLGLGAVQYALVPRGAAVIYSPTAMALTIVTYAAIGAAVLWAARRTGDARRALGLVAPRSWTEALVLVPLTVIGALAVSAALEPLLHAAKQQGLVPDSGRPPGLSPIVGAALAFVAIALVGPFVEEMLFRGLLTASFRLRLGPLRTALLTGALFALAHLLPRGLPALLVLGVALALLYERTGSTASGIMVHCLYNGIALSLALSHH